MHYDLSDQYRHRESLIHHLDPRVKVVVTLLYILCVSLTPEGRWWTFSFLFLAILIAGLLTSLGLTFILQRSLIVLPFALAAVAVPFTTPGQILLDIPGLGWTISYQGIARFLSILLRSWLAVQAAILLTFSTRFPDLIWALGALRLPRPLVSTIAFMYRYIFVLADEALRMIRARTARSADPTGRVKHPLLWQGKVTGSMVGSLFIRALERSERIYGAMLARGYDGYMRSLHKFQIANQDWLFLFTATVVLVTPLVITLLR